METTTHIPCALETAGVWAVPGAGTQTSGTLHPALSVFPVADDTSPIITGHLCDPVTETQKPSGISDDPTVPPSHQMNTNLHFLLRTQFSLDIL